MSEAIHEACLTWQEMVELGYAKKDCLHYRIATWKHAGDWRGTAVLAGELGVSVPYATKLLKELVASKWVTYVKEPGHKYPVKRAWKFSSEEQRTASFWPEDKKNNITQNMGEQNEASDELGSCLVPERDVTYRVDEPTHVAQTTPESIEEPTTGVVQQTVQEQLAANQHLGPPPAKPKRIGATHIPGRLRKKADAAVVGNEITSIPALRKLIAAPLIGSRLKAHIPVLSPLQELVKILGDVPDGVIQEENILRDYRVNNPAGLVAKLALPSPFAQDRLAERRDFSGDDLAAHDYITGFSIWNSCRVLPSKSEAITNPIGRIHDEFRQLVIDYTAQYKLELLEEMREAGLTNGV